MRASRSFPYEMPTIGFYQLLRREQTAKVRVRSLCLGQKFLGSVVLTNDT